MSEPERGRSRELGKPTVTESARNSAMIQDITAGGNVTIELKVGDEAPVRIVVPRPFEVPAAVGDFTGRTREIATLTEVLEGNGRATVSAISGMGGVGKSQLAWEVAHRLRERFPDGQIYFDLRGTAEMPLTPALVMARVIEAFDRNAKPPDDMARLAADYRTTLRARPESSAG